MRRRLSAILSADVSTYSGLMAKDEEGTITRLHAVMDAIVTPGLSAQSGRLFKSMGDGFLAEFSSPVEAVRFALAMQNALAKKNQDANNPPLNYRIGINLCDVVEDGEDLLGDGVNIAARLDALAPPGGICISRAVHEQLRGKIDAPCHCIGMQDLKNIPEPVEVWQIDCEPGASIPDMAPRSRSAAVLAVLPFEERGGGEDAFAEGVVEEITLALSRTRQFSVIARQSAHSLKGSRKSVPEIGKVLGADYIITGSVRRLGSRVRISVELSDAISGIQLWTDRFDDELNDLFELLDSVAGHVAREISPSIRASEIASARSTRPRDRDAYALYMSAHPHFWAHKREENERAIHLLDLALERNAMEGRARALRAWCYAQQAAYNWTKTPLISREKAFSDADAAEPLIGDHVPSLVSIGAALGIATTDLFRSQAAIDRALSIDPNSAWGWMRLGWTKNYRGLCDEALSHFDRAETLSPRDPFLFNMDFGRAFAYGILGEYEKAVELVKKGLSAGTGVTWAYRDLASFLANAGRKKEADEAVAMLLKHYPDLTIRQVHDGMPPTVVNSHATFFEGLRRAGVPES